MTPFETLLTTIIGVIFALWITASFWEMILPQWLFVTAQHLGVILAIPFCMYGGGGSGAVRSVPLASEPLSESMRLPPRTRPYVYHEHWREERGIHVAIPQKKATKRSVSETLKKVVAARQQWMCDSCSRILPPHFEVDHIISLADGGSNDASNLRALCRDCHGWKSTKDRLRWNGEL